MLKRLVAELRTPKVREWAYNASGFNRYGLWHDDLLNEEAPDVAEAIRRLPEKIRDERNFRMIRANQLYINNDYLPREQWTRPSDEVHYLEPYLEEVRAELREKAAWEKDH